MSRSLAIPIKAADKAAEAIPFMLKGLFVCAVVAFVIYKYKHRFIKMKEISSYPDANVTLEQAKARAEGIYGSVYWFSGDFESIKANLTGLNYNGFVRVYNAFGEHTGHLLSGELDLILFLKDQLSEYEIQQLRFLLGGAFF